MGKSSINGSFSMAMLNNQRVTFISHEIRGLTSSDQKVLFFCCFMALYDSLYIN